jgi:hypothetical protein
MGIGTIDRRRVLGALLLGAGAGLGLAARRQPGTSEPVRAVLQDLRFMLAGEDIERELGWLEKSLKPDAVLPTIAGLALDDLRFALSRSSLSGPSRLSLQALVVKDLKIKAAYCRQHPLGMAALVRLTVRTWSQPPAGNRLEQADWQVMYVCTPQTLLPTYSGRSFPRFSSPSFVDLPPGLWTLWAQHPVDPLKRGPAREVTLGATPEVTTLDADLLVP